MTDEGKARAVCADNSSCPAEPSPEWSQTTQGRSGEESTKRRNAHRLSKEDQLYVFGLLRTIGLVGQIWPVYAWDKTPPVYGLTLGRDMALQELNGISDIQITERQLRTVLATYGIAEGPIEPKLIAEFLRKRRDRRTDKTSSRVLV